MPPVTSLIVSNIQGPRWIWEGGDAEGYVSRRTLPSNRCKSTRQELPAQSFEALRIVLAQAGGLLHVAAQEILEVPQGLPRDPVADVNRDVTGRAVALENLLASLVDIAGAIDAHEVGGLRPGAAQLEDVDDRLLEYDV